MNISFLDMPVICAGFLAFGILMYVLLDGFDLGVGILFEWAPNDHDRDVMMSTVAPVWDGNATWLIYGGGILFAAFPVAYAIILPALYIPLMIMLIALMFRGVAFEFRMKASAKNRWIWDNSFWLGSTITALMQGMMLGSLIEGFKIENNQFVGGPFDFFTSFSIVTGFSLIMGYGLLGATWIIKKTTGPLQEWARSIAKPLLLFVLLAILLISLKTPVEYPHIYSRWFSWPNILYLSWVPLATLLLSGLLLWGIVYKRCHTPFTSAIGLFSLSYFGLIISFWPDIVIGKLSFWQAAAPDSSLRFLLVVLSISLPIVLFYTFLIYRIFRGKVDPKKSYY